MKTTDNNKLIAEFMGMETDENGMYRYTTSVDDYTTDDLSYFEYSWDWLMPVVEKIENLGYWVNRNDGDVTISNESDIIVNTPMSSGGIEMMYKSVVQFINQYNNQ